jgi:uncharacterized protein YfaS (alpha-2-macroglobulin family)
MKNYFLVFGAMVLLQLQCAPKKTLQEVNIRTDNYAAAWKSIDSLEQKGLYRSALPAVKALVSKSVAENNPAQAHKALMYKLRFDQTLNENYEVELVPFLDSLIAAAGFPVNNMLSGSVANILWNHYQNNQWSILARQSDATGTDIREWSRKNFIEKVAFLHQQALINSDELAEIPWYTVQDALNGDSITCKIHPTLLDLLAHQALDFYMNDQANLLPIDKTIAPTAHLFSNNIEFIQLSPAPQSNSYWHVAIQLWQKLTVKHMDRKNFYALAEVTVARLNAFRPYVKEENSDLLYFEALSKLADESKADVASVVPLIQMASFLESKGQQRVTVENTEEKWYLRDALKYVEQVLKMEGGPERLRQQAESIKSRILNKQLSITAEQIVLPNSEWLAAINYRNLKEVFVAVAKIDYETYLDVLENHEREKQIELLTSKALIRNLDMRFEISDQGDYRPHSLEVAMPPLSSGFYIVVSAPQNHITYDKTNIYINPVWVSNIAWSHRSTPDGKNEFHFVNRKSGRAAKNIETTIYTQQYNQYKRRLVLDKGPQFKAGEDGYLVIPQTSSAQRFRIKISSANETVWPEQSYYQYTASVEEKPYVQTHFFTDRKVYRPGQEVYFKAIAVEYIGEERKLKTGLSETVFLYDANHQVVHKQSFKTNEFGSYHGSFVLPETGLTGTFRIETARGQQYFNVEEYKRPTFSVNVNQPDSGYALNGKVTVKGEALALAGFPITDAAVNYRVERTVEMPWWRWWRGGWPNSGAREQIAFGTLKTDANGKFIIEFIAMEPDKISYPDEYYRFEITADVVDVSGETRAATQSVVVGKTTLLLSTFNAPIAKAGELNEIEITATNLNGSPVNASGKVEIYQLIPAQKAFRKRLWPATDQYQLSIEEFSKRFPIDEVLSDTSGIKPRLGEKVFDKSFNTAHTTKVDVPASKNWKAGQYMIKLSANDSKGEPVKFEHIFTFYNTSDSKPAVPDFLWSHVENPLAQPGEDVRLQISSGVEVEILVETELKGKIINRQTLLIKDKLVSLKIPVLESYRGNFSLHISTTCHNRFYQQSHNVEVPHSNKKLNLAIETFRDKMEPGSNEEWTVKITDDKNKAVSAEVLAGMYDASLDALGFPNSWLLFPFVSRGSRMAWSVAGAFDISGGWAYQKDWNEYVPYYPASPCGINYFGLGSHYYDIKTLSMGNSDMLQTRGSRIETRDMDGAVAEKEMSLELVANDTPAPPASVAVNPVQVRENFNETAFFQPQLYTDKNGILSVKFTLPESITSWKFMALGHTKSLQIGEVSQEVVAQKTLMVIPNAPRFMRHGDEFLFTGKVVNLSTENVSAEVSLSFTDVEKGSAANLLTGSAKQNITLASNESKAVQWNVKVPENLNWVDFVMSAISEKHSDGEKRSLAVLPNRMLVTESMPMPVYGKGITTFQFDHLLKSAEETGLKHHRLTLEFSANPAWYAVQALPYLMEYPYDCSEQIFTRFYANSLAAHIVSSKPGIAEMFKKYSTQTPEALWSNLQKNQELKGVLLEETPWVLNAQNEAESKKNMALLFDLNRMAAEQQKAIDKLAEAQLAEGAWPWFKGMMPSRYITQYLVEGMGRLKYLGVDATRHTRMTAMADKAILWLDIEFVKDFKKIKKPEEERLHAGIVYYLYVRSLFPERARSAELQKAFDFYLDKAPGQWVELDLYSQGMLALATYRMNRKSLSEEIVKSLAERSIFNNEQGRYWKNTWGFYWYNLPIETHSLMVEVFSETGAQKTFVNELKLWLLKQKQVQHWKTTKATANACYALLMSGDDWLKNTAMPVIKVGDFEVVYTDSEKGINKVFVQPEPGTGHFKAAWTAEEISPKMANVSIDNKHDGPAWGALYWQYFQDMDKIIAHDTPLKITREYFHQQSVDGVKKSIPLGVTSVKPGDRVLVRIVLETDRDMEFVHLKDQRAAGLEPMESRSGYEWNGGLGYYRSIRDASTNFFFDWLPKGRHVFEYELRANLSGDFTHGIGTVQCMYAPEFSAHSRGQRFVIE